MGNKMHPPSPRLLRLPGDVAERGRRADPRSKSVAARPLPDNVLKLVMRGADQEDNIAARNSRLTGLMPATVEGPA
jgi:hypothetical protein